MDTRSLYFVYSKAIQKYLAHPFKSRTLQTNREKRKAPEKQELFLEETGLFQFSFFVNNVFTGYWVKFFDFQFARHSTFIFSSCVEVTSTSTGLQFDFIRALQ